MPNKLLNRWYGFHVAFHIIFAGILIFLLAFFNWIIAIVSGLVLAVLIYLTYRSEISYRKEFHQYIETISYRVKKVGAEAFQNFPIGIILFDEDKKIEWHNSQITQITEQEQLIGKALVEVIPDLAWIENQQKAEIQLGEKIYQVEIRPKERLLYFKEITEYKNLAELYESERPVIGIIHLDNLDEVGQGMDDLSRSLLLTDVSSAINDWASDLQIYLRRFTSDKFLLVTNQLILEQLEYTRFDILDIVREITVDNKIPLTLSIGVGAGAGTLVELGEMAQSSLDIALGRGGDQAAVKDGERLSFYGGKSNAIEKRTRVRARVISHALRDLIKESDVVLIMGHKIPDMDALGSAIGILKAVRVNNAEGYIILDKMNPMIKKVLEEIMQHKELSSRLLVPEKALSMVTPKTLLVVVDTHKPSLTIEPKLVEEVERIVVIDHHRRGEEIVQDPVLNYIEPYASSTSELVTELLQYQSDKLRVDSIEATVLLAGIVVDTKNFTYRTGSRTFEAASFLRTNGADPVLVQKILQEELDQYIKKAEIIKNAKIYFNNIAIAVAKEETGQLLIAQAADTLLNLSGVLASFVISMRPDGIVAISARSQGKINVQVIMERLGGGGHLTNAAVQLEGVTLEKGEQKLINILKLIQQEGGLTI